MIRFSSRISVFDHDAFSLNIAIPAQTLPECFDVRTCGRCLRQETYPWNISWLLRHTWTTKRKYEYKTEETV
jgi:hypothetical protein